MKFDTASFPYVWMFQSYGGWRGHYVVVVEPCTTLPSDLEEACRNGTVALLQPQEHQRRSSLCNYSAIDCTHVFEQ